MSSKKRWSNLIISLIGAGIIAAYDLYGQSCASYSGNNLFGIELRHLGLFYMGMLILLNLLRKELILLLLLSFGVGAEIYLIGFQITNEVYCYYCLAFEAIIALLFLLNLKMSQGSIAGILIFAGFIIIAGFTFFLVFFKGAVVSSFVLTSSPCLKTGALRRFFGNNKYLILRFLSKN